MSHFQGKVAIVTGGASGIGRGLCELLGAQGAAVIVADLNGEGAEEVASCIRKAGGQASAQQVDVTRSKQVEQLIRGTASEQGRLDFMFNNAGIAIVAEIRDMSMKHWRQIIDVNLMGVIYGTTAAYSLMCKQGFGHIVNTASLAGLLPVPTETAYAATKFGVVGLSMSLRGEAEDLGIRVSVICPAFVQTGIFEAATAVKVNVKELVRNIPFKIIPSDVAARVILKGVEKNRDVITLPFYARLIWWMYRINPTLLLLLQRKLMRDFRSFRE